MAVNMQAHLQALRDKQKAAAATGYTSAGTIPTPTAPVEQPRITRQDGANGTYQIMGTLTPEERAQWDKTDATGHLGIAQTAYNNQQAGIGVGTNSVTNNGQGNTSSYTDQLNAARRNQVMADLGKSRDNALMNLQGERAQVKPRYTDARNQTAAGSQQSARSLAEFMANRGGVKSGANAQAEISRQGTLQGNIGSLNRQENMTNDDLGRRETGVRNAYESDLQSANAGLEGDRMQALLNQFNQDKAFSLQEAGLTGTYLGNQTLGGKSLGLQQQGQAYDQANQDWNNRFNYGQATGTFANGQQTLQKTQQDWSNAFTEGQFDFNKAQTAYENTFKERNFQQDMKDAAASRGLQWTSMNNQQQARLADDAFREKQFEYTKTQDTIANNLKSGKTADYNYKEDDEFKEEVANFMKDPLGAASYMRENSQAYIEKYGYDGYNALFGMTKK